MYTVYVCQYGYVYVLLYVCVCVCMYSDVQHSVCAVQYMCSVHVQSQYCTKNYTEQYCAVAMWCSTVQLHV